MPSLARDIIFEKVRYRSLSFCQVDYYLGDSRIFRRCGIDLNCSQNGNKSLVSICSICNTSKGSNKRSSRPLNVQTDPSLSTDTNHSHMYIDRIHLYNSRQASPAGFKKGRRSCYGLQIYRNGFLWNMHVLCPA